MSHSLSHNVPLIYLSSSFLLFMFILPFTLHVWCQHSLPVFCSVHLLSLFLITSPQPLSR